MIIKSAIDDFLNRELRDSSKAKMFSAEAIDRKIAALPYQITLRSTLRKHQKVCFLLGVKYPRYLELLDMGLGKSLISLALFLYRKVTEPNLRMLVLVPGSANVGQWADEVHKHTHLECTAVDVTGSANRMLLINGSADVVVITYMGFLSLVCSGKVAIDEKTKEPKINSKTGEVLTKGWALDPKKLRIFQNHFQFVVFDESTTFRSSRRGRSIPVLYQAVKKLSWGAKYAYALTGTPFGKDPAAVWPQFNVIDKGETFGETLGLFRAALFIEKDDYWAWKVYKFDERKRNIFNRMLRHNSIRYRIEDCEDLPPKVKVKVPVIFDPETWQYYDRLVEELKESHKDGSFNVKGNPFIRMRQLTSGYLVVTDPEGEKTQVTFKNNPKLEAMMERIEAIPEDRKIIVFHEYIRSGQLISDRLKKEKIKHVRLFSGTKNKNAEVQKFLHDPKVRMIVSSSAGAYGGNWQIAPYTIWFEEPVDPMILKQEQRRNWRIGQTEKVVWTSLLVKGSIDERIHASLAKGENLFQKLIEGKESATIFSRF